MKRAIGFFCLAVFFVAAATAAQAGWISEISEITFQNEVIEADMPVIVWFFFNPGVSVYDAFSNAIDKVSQKNAMRVKVLKMDSQYNSITGDRYKIKKSNTFVLFVEGKEVARSSEIRGEKDFGAFIDSCLGPPPKVTK
ncbi:MAG: thioredoxin family protein [Candidatus Eremiobacteraeota bacterium]|nr:thioredoxin family protein [Candidatus Eremiobacteraeota bacterium]